MDAAPAPVVSACTRHCGDGCSLLVTPLPGGGLEIKGNPEHPHTRGFICAKTARFWDRINSPERITTPLLRKGRDFEPVSWDQALALIAGRIQDLRATPERMLHVLYYASFGVLFQASRLLFTSLGASGFSGSPCLAAGDAALKAAYGAVRQAPLSRVEHAGRIVNWGRNARMQSVHLAALLANAQKRGARILTIHPGDPGYNVSGARQILVRPGTDRFLAAAAAKILLESGRLSPAALARCADPETYLELLRRMDLEDLLAACGVSRDQAGLLADFYDPAQDGPTATLIGRGLQRYPQGGENVRFIDALALASGNVGVDGGGVFYKQGDLKLVPAGWALAQPGYGRKLPIHALAHAAEQADPPVDFVWVEGMNLVTQCPESLATRAMLEKRFSVVVEPFLTDTARAASVILPPALALEWEDVTKADSHECANLSAKVLAPRGQARSNFDIAAGLGALLDPPVHFPAPEDVLEQTLRQGALHAGLADIRRKGWLKLAIPPTPWADGVFAHDDGLYRLPGELTPQAPLPQGYPLRLVSFGRPEYLLSQIPERDQAEPRTAYLAPATFERLGLSPGQQVRLETEQGGLTVVLAVLESLHPEAVYYPRGDWLCHGGGINSLIPGQVTDVGGQVAYYGQGARLVPAAPPAS